MTPIEQIEALNQRLAKARELFEQDKIHPILNGENLFAVESSTQSSFWLVNGDCGCPDAIQRADVHRGWCKHMLAVELYKESQVGKPQADQTKENSRAKPKNKIGINTETDETGLYPKA